MLLMGMWINFTKKPMKPMIANPSAVAMAIFWNSVETSPHKVANKWESLLLTFQVWLGTALDQSHRVLGKVLHRFYVLVNNVHLCFVARSNTVWVWDEYVTVLPHPFKMATASRLKKLRLLMSQLQPESLAAYIIPTDDCHQVCF